MSQISSSNPPERFLLIRTDRIGDTILTLPVVSALRKKYPAAFIVFLAQPYTTPLIEQYEGIDLLLTYEPERQHKGWQGIMRLSRELEELKIDTALLFYPRVELAFALFKAKIPLRIGSAYRWYSFLLNQRIFEHRKECQKHEAEYNLSMLVSLLHDETQQPHAEFKKWSPEPWWGNFRAELNFSEYVIVHPGSGASAPNLNKTQYRLIIGLLLEKTNWTVLLTGTSGEEQLIHELASGFTKERVKELACRFSLVEFFSVIRNSSLLITSSTGPLHLANASGTPLLGFFCPVKPHTPQRWGPYDQQKWVVTPKLESPEICKLKNCPYGGCLQLLSDSEITTELCENRLKDLI